MRNKTRPQRQMVVDPEAATFLPQVMDKSPNTPLIEPGRILRMVRTSLRMTIEQLARRSGIDRAHITRMEAGQVDGQWKTWRRLFEALGCRLAIRVQAEGGLERLFENALKEAAQRRQAHFESLRPGKPLSDAERQADVQTFIETLRERNTSELWDELTPS